MGASFAGAADCAVDDSGFGSAMGRVDKSTAGLFALTWRLNGDITGTLKRSSVFICTGRGDTSKMQPLPVYAGARGLSRWLRRRRSGWSYM